MIARLPFALGASLAAGLLAALMIGRAQPARPPIIQARTGATFLERWQEPVSPMVPTPVRVIPITPRAKPPVVIAQAPVVKKEAPPPVKAKPKPKRERDTSDICRGMGKKWTANKRSWRCKRS